MVACSATKQSPSVLWNPKVHRRVHNSPPPVPILSQINPIYILLTYFAKINFSIVLPSTTRSSECSLPCRPANENSLLISHLPHARYMPRPSQIPWLDHLVIFSEGHKCWSSSLCSFLQHPVTSSPSRPNILHPCSSLNARDQVSHSHKISRKIILLTIC
jgi:hypothetical protein